MASGYGIDFSPTGDATGITPSAEVLDEYEEGIATYQIHINLFISLWTNHDVGSVRTWVHDPGLTKS